MLIQIEVHACSCMQSFSPFQMRTSKHHSHIQTLMCKESKDSNHPEASRINRNHTKVSKIELQPPRNLEEFTTSIKTCLEMNNNHHKSLWGVQIQGL